METGARVLVDALVRHGVELIFGVPGESYITVLDALLDSPSLHYVVCRQEGGATAMAEAHGKLTGRPGVAFVTRGPGATNASIGVHIARQDETPMLLFIGQVPRALRGREAFQEVDFATMFEPLAKWAVEVDAPERLGDVVARAFEVAASGRPGPVVVALPEDVLSATGSPPAPLYDVRRPSASAATLDACRGLLAGAQRPLVLVGGGRWSERAALDLQTFAAQNALPVVVDFRCQDYFDNAHPCFAGYIGFGMREYEPGARALTHADTVLALGTRLGEVVTGTYRFLQPPRPKQRLIHVYPDPAELGRVYQADLPVAADPVGFAASLATLEPFDARTWAEATALAHAAYDAWSTPSFARPVAGTDMCAVVEYLRARLPKDAIVTNGAGNFAAWVHRFYRHRRYGTQLAARNGAMGYGLPAAIAAKLLHPERTVVSVVGDGDLLMTSQELATAALEGTAIVVIVVNNGMYGTIRLHQERRFPGRTSGTTLRNPDFVAFGRAFGAHAELVSSSQAFPAAFERAASAGRAALLEVQVDSEVILPGTTIDDVRRASGAAVSARA
ncbi:MAG: thiamine pyrophosphate-dependent enzyme [Vulcanimicrobiaceae bacterium]